MTDEGAPDRPSIGRPLGMRFDELEHGRVVTSLQTRPDFANPLGTVPGGIAASLLDSVVGCTVHTRRCQLHDPRTGGRRHACGPDQRRDRHRNGIVIHNGQRVATAEGWVVDDRDRLIAHATTTCTGLQS